MSQTMVVVRLAAISNGWGGGGGSFVSPAAPPNFTPLLCLLFIDALGIVWSEFIFLEIAN